MERRKFIAGIPALATVGTLISGQEHSQKGSEFSRYSDCLEQIYQPVFRAWTEGRLVKTLDRAEFPRKQRNAFLALEAVARNFYCLCQVDKAGRFLTPEILRALENSLKPGQEDSFNWDKGEQPLVDAAILAAGFLQNPFLFEKKLTPGIQAGLLEGWRSSLKIKPFDNNWLLFAAMVEAALQKWDKPFKPESIPHALKKFEDWYLGDGWYGDGPRFHLDYYNSIIIHPFLLILGKLGHVEETLRTKHLPRAQRHAVQLERMIGKDGSIPPLGRSLCYRAGLFHHLAFMAKEELLPPGLLPGKVRTGLSQVIEKTLNLRSDGKIGKETRDPVSGILRPGLFGFEPQLAEAYINSASLYLTTWAFLPLALGEEHDFWKNPKGISNLEEENLGIDQALKD
jgi:hypothetical protein